MAIEKVSKVQIVGFQEIKRRVVELLQERKLLHLQGISFRDFSGQEFGLLKDIENVLKALDEVEGGHLLGEVFPPKIFLWEEKFQTIDTTGSKKILEELKEILHKKEMLLSTKLEMEKKISQISEIEFITVRLKDLRSLTRSEILFLKILPRNRKELASLDLIYLCSLGFIKKKEVIAVCVRKEDKESILRMLGEKKIEVVSVPFEVWEEFEDYTPREVKQALIAEHSQVEDKIQQLNTEIKGYLKYREELMILYDHILNESFKEKVTGSFPKTRRLFVLQGWVLKEKEKEILALGKELGDKILVQLREPQKGEVPPTRLRNKPLLEPFQILVNMYGAPHPASLDPTAFLAPFFFLFVGICISDAGYGAVLTGLSWYVLKKKRLTPGGRVFFKLLSLLGISTLISGLALGGAFGFSLPFRVIDILSSPFQFLLFCFLLGFLHVFLGVVLRVYLEFQNRNYRQAVAFLSWAGILVSLPLAFVFKTTVFKLGSGIFAAGILLFSSGGKNIFKRIAIGLYELYGITRYFSDVLSYSRLLALGMATGVIAMVVNLLAKSVLGIPVLGIVLACGIFIMGHMFNLFINLMGGFIHSARLQFVEFFSKFYTLGKEFFQPLKIETKYVAFLKEK